MEIGKDYIAISIINVKSKYLHGECTSNFEVNTICSWMQQQFDKTQIDLTIIDKLSEKFFEIKNDVIFLNSDYTLEDILDNYKNSCRDDISNILFNENDMIARICRYKELQCEYMQRVYQEHIDKSYKQESTVTNGK